MSGSAFDCLQMSTSQYLNLFYVTVYSYLVLQYCVSYLVTHRYYHVTTQILIRSMDFLH